MLTSSKKIWVIHKSTNLSRIKDIHVSWELTKVQAKRAMAILN